MKNETVDQVKIGILILVAIILFGTIGYEIIEEEWSVLDSFYMTVITISTTGFKEVKDLSEAGRIFTIFLIISGVITIAYIGGKFAQFILETQLLRRNKMSKKIDLIGNHYIVCGYGRMGREICDGLRESNAPFVIVENDEKKIEVLKSKAMLFVQGDATHDEVLFAAGIERAKGLVAVLRTDAENVFATLSAKELNKNIYVVARAIEDGSESKLKKAGADRVVLPYELGGTRMVQLLLRPGVIDFIDGLAKDKTRSISLEEISVPFTSPLAGKTLVESPVRRELNIIIVAVHKNNGQFIYNPKSTTIIEGGDKLIAIGEQTDLTKLTDLCNL